MKTEAKYYLVVHDGEIDEAEVYKAESLSQVKDAVARELVKDFGINLKNAKLMVKIEFTIEKIQCCNLTKKVESEN
jgi:hypothetical protein